MDTADKVLLGAAAVSTSAIVWVMLTPHQTALPPPAPVCPTGFVMVNGACTPDSTGCPTGFVMVGGACSPIGTPGSTGACANFKNCWAYFAQDTGKGYVRDSEGTFHWVHDPCAWWQCGYPYPPHTAANTTDVQVQACAATSGGMGMNICNDTNENCLGGCAVGCGYTTKCGFSCTGDWSQACGSGSNDCRACNGACGVVIGSPCSCGQGPMPGCAGLARE